MPGPGRSGDAAPRRSRFRWVVCGLLFFATLVNYVDRQVIGVLKPLLEDELGWSEIDYANLVFAFQAAYAVGYAGGGRLIDRFGLRLGFALAVAAWSLAAMGHAAARSLAGFAAARAALGLAEGANFPAAVYLMTDVGSIGGGWLSSALIRRGWSVNAARKSALLVCALLVVPIVFASRVSELWPAVLLVGLAASAHQGFSANLFTLVSDTVPPAAVSSVVGIGGMAGAVGGMLVAQAVGLALTLTGSYALPFACAGAAYLLALAVIHALLPRLEPMRLG
jgi:MFS family permease